MSRDKCLTCCWYARRLRLLTHFKFSCLSRSLSLCPSGIFKVIANVSSHIFVAFFLLWLVFSSFLILDDSTRNRQKWNINFSFILHALNFSLKSGEQISSSNLLKKNPIFKNFYPTKHESLEHGFLFSLELFEEKFLKYARWRSNGRHRYPI